MDYTQTFAISAAGMALERSRVDVAALNLANAHTLQAPDGASYRPMRVVARTAHLAGLPDGQSDFDQLVNDGLAENLLAGLAPVASVEPQNTAPRLVYEPGHPMANEKGFLTYPGVDPANEMMTMMSAMRAYEANVAAMNTARALSLKALEIGGASS